MQSTNRPQRLYIPQPFASATGASLTAIEEATSNNVNFADGFPAVYEAPSANNGKFVMRGEMNAIGNLASRNEFARACGGIVTFDQKLANKIGGYPRGAILEVLDGVSYYHVVSLVEDNMVDFTGSALDTSIAGNACTIGTVDGVNWARTDSDDAVIKPTVLADIDLGEIDAVTKMKAITMNAASFVTPRSGAVSVALTLGELVTSGEAATFTYSATLYYKVPGWTPASQSDPTPSIRIVGNDQSGSSASEAVRLPAGTLCSVILAFGNIHFKSVKLKAELV